METKTGALALLIIVLILLFAVILFTIKSARRRKSLAIPAEGDGNKRIYKNESRGRKPDLWGIPSWGLALLTMFLAFVVLMVVGDIITAIFKIPESNGVDLAFYIVYNLIIAGGCFFICRQDPESIIYVPVLSNLIGIISSIAEPTFWSGSLWMVICGGWVLSIIASFIGASVGRRTDIPDKSNTR
jgi:CBS domain containing-hemolysin-like protein